MTKLEMLKAMHGLVCAMNNEGAYETWIYIVPDGATEEDLQDIADDEELLKESVECFNRIVRAYGKDGYYVEEKVW